MGSALHPNLQAMVTRYTLARIQRIQLLIPLAVLASTFAQRLPGVLTLSISLAIMAAFWLVLRGAVTRLGLQTVRVDGDVLRIGTDISIPRGEVQRWTFSNGVASLLCGGTSYRLRMDRNSEAGIENCLRSLLGAPTMLQKRGSPRARVTAGAVMVVGLAATATAFVLESMPLVIIGVPATILGFAAFATLSSQRIVGSEQTTQQAARHR